MDIAAMQAVVMAPHTYNSVLCSRAAAVHVCAIIPDFRIAECFVNCRDAYSAVATVQIAVNDGWAELPVAPGLGVERLRSYPFKAFPQKPLNRDVEEYPRKDYVPSLLAPVAAAAERDQPAG